VRTPNGTAARVVVVGAGFAGLAAVDALAGSGADVTLVDRHPYSTFQPLLYQVATAGLTSADVAYPLWAVARKRRARFRRGELTGIDRNRREVQLADGTRIGYDYLVLTTGVSAAFFGVAGAAEYALSLYTRHDAVVLRDELLAELEYLAADPSGELHITVAGGGATGVELAGTLAELRNIALPATFPEIRQERMHVTLVEAGDVLLAPFDPALRAYTLHQLLSRGVDVRLSTAIQEVREQEVVLAGGEMLRSDVTVWAAGVAGPAGIGALGLATGRGGRLLTGSDLRVQGDERIFAAGDIGLIEGYPLPQLAQPAIQQGTHVAAQIRRLMQGKDTAEFRYKDKGIMATIGRRSAVVQLPGRIKIKGTIAWFAWLVLHLVTLLGHRNRITALVNLSWRYLTWSRGGGVIIGDETPAPRHEHAPAGRPTRPG
jgi:NADH:ubiquinone reductase (H+-translocating)